MEHVTFCLALCKSRKITGKNYAKNARIPALGYGAVQKKDESQEAEQLPEPFAVTNLQCSCSETIDQMYLRS